MSWKTEKLISSKLELISRNFEKTVKKLEEYNKLPKLTEDIYEDGKYVRIVKIKEEEKFFNYLQEKKFLNKELEKYSKEMILISQSLFELDTINLDIKEIDFYLIKIQNLRAYVLPIINRITEKGLSALSEKKINKIREVLNHSKKGNS